MNYRALCPIANFPVVMLATLFSIEAIAMADEPPAPAQPNIIVLFADDMGWGDIGANGHPMIRTPAIDQLAAEGQRWTNFYVSSPVCSPSRGALLTGRLPVRTGLYGRNLAVYLEDEPGGFPEQEETIAETLKKAGYQTGMVGKWHLGDKPHAYPTRHGFDYWFGAPYSNDVVLKGNKTIAQIYPLMSDPRNMKEIMSVMQRTSAALANPKSDEWMIPLIRSQRKGNKTEDEVVALPLDQPNHTRHLTEEANGFIRNSTGTPFFLYVAYAMPHVPLFASEAYAGKSEAGRYGDAVEELDWSVGEIINTLRELNIDENTLVVFTSDNGPWLEFGAHAGSAGPLRGGKGQTFEGGVREPGIFWWPNTIKPGIVTEIGSTLDLFATFSDLGGGEIRAANTDGFSLSGVLRGNSKSPRDFMPYYHYGELHAYRSGHWKMHFREQPSLRGDKDGRHVGALLDKPALYHLGEDPGERFDVADKHPEVLLELKSASQKLMATINVAEPLFDQRFKFLNTSNN